MTLPWNEYAEMIGFADEAEMLNCFFVKDCQPPTCVADYLGVSPSVVRTHMMKHGIPIKSPGGSNHGPATKRKWHMRAVALGFESERHMLESYRRHYRDLAIKLEVRHETVWRRLRRYGLTPARGHFFRADKKLAT